MYAQHVEALDVVKHRAGHLLLQQILLELVAPSNCKKHLELVLQRLSRGALPVFGIQCKWT